MGLWFHDVEVSRINIDYAKREVAFDCAIEIGFWNTPNRENLTEGVKRTTLIMSGLLYIFIQPPDEGYPYEDSEAITIGSEGSVTPEKFKEQWSQLPNDLPEDAFLHYFYVEEWNRGIFVAATGARFAPAP